MATVDVRFRIDKDLKESMEKVCLDIGLSMAEAFVLFAIQ